jgi:protein-S-isoprenylcysteine O-methyltransferase Ste14
MVAGTIFRMAFFTLLGAMMVIRMAFSVRVHQQGERNLPDRQAIQYEGVVLFGLRVVLGVVLAAVLVLYTLDHPRIKALSFALPGWLRWVGFASGWLSLVPLAWAEIELGRQFSPQLQQRQAHKLITKVPYAHIRHLLYIGIYGFALSLALVSSNWSFVAFFILSLLVLGARMPREEEIKINQFGEAYWEYMRRTVRYWPRI